MRLFKEASYENRLLAVLFLAFGFVFFDRLALSYLFPFVSAELGLSNTELGMLSSVLALAWAVSGAFMGAYTDRRGRRKTILIVSVVLFSVFSALSGLVTGFISLLLFRACMGLTEGPVLPLSQTMMAQASSPHRRGLNMGLLQGSSAGLMGAVIAPPVMVALAENFGWRTAFYLTCIPGLIVAWLIWRYVQEPAPARPDEAGTMAGTAQGAAALPAGPQWGVLRERNVILCILISCFFLAWFINIISFAPTFLVSVRQFSPGTMSALMSCLGLAWVIWGFAVPGISDRIGRRPTLFIFSLVAACCPLAFLYAPTAVALGILLLLTYTGLGCFTLFMATIPAETVPRGAMATALGLIMGIGELIGGFIAPVAAGRAADLYGLPVVMWISMAGALIAGLLSLGLRETAPAVLARQKAGQATGQEVGQVARPAAGEREQGGQA
ncbi:MFS transporter [Kerstersia similis]|uniref:MFS transporter n=1 Tax=Kerstersia similis TaxID=206505 RepID=UPI0039F05C58